MSLKKYAKAVQGVKESEEYYEELSSTISIPKLRQWKNQMSTALSGRLSNFKAMDIFDTRVENGALHNYSPDQALIVTLLLAPSCAEQQLLLIQSENQSMNLYVSNLS